ncbi:hypothetical protein BMS3Bbin12_01657 [bacterium BMS3Bbin12]|nr:hypothetical protein BMS3Bbin12_01657 [bacterium BMS3Bbin12]GBE50438.1 hypothetical protein BMS3Bbin13_01377 [bacterium BMS3Bbin13]
MNHGRTMRRIAYHAALDGLLSVALGLASTAVYAVPSFARQTGMPCDACHTVFPELTAFGRDFKLNGYTLTGMKQIKATGAAGSMKINAIPPLSVMLQVGFTHVAKTRNVPGGAQNNNVAFPDGLSLYYAGEISPHMGTFLQVTMDNSNSGFGFDMADFRYANRATLGGRPLVYGVTLDNSPGMEDVWNTTPAWNYPYIGSSTAPDNGIAQSQLFNIMGAGFGGYALWDNHWYGAVSLYRSAAAMGSTDRISNVAPYWRFAWQGTLPNRAYLEVGTYGLYAKLRNQPTSTTTTLVPPCNTIATIGCSVTTTTTTTPNGYTKYADWAMDGTYQQPLSDGNLLSLHALYLHENQTRTSGSNILQQFRADANYEIGHRAQASLGYFNSWGSGASVTNANTVIGDTAGVVAEADYLPWENTKFSLQYTAYTKYAGSSTASDNNTLYLNSWLLW